jgi:raffinose/stachyose/melibiose transport system permease protein
VAQQPAVQPAQLASIPRPKWTWYRFVTKIGIPWLFILPIMALHIVVVAIPAVSSIYFSLTDWSGINQPVFIGLENYRKIFTDDPQVGSAFVHNVIWLSFFLTVPFILALFAASLLAQIKRGGMIYRTLLFIPFILPSVVTASIWRNLLSPRMGIFAQLANWGIGDADIALLGRSSTVLLTIAFIDNWHWWGFLMILFLTAMQSIPVELYDAAKIDGANGWQEFRYVTLPGIRPVVLFMLMMSAIWSFLAFDYIWILTQGGPAGASDVMATVLYRNAFARFEAGYAAAQGLLLSALAGVIVLFFLYLRRRGWEI